MVHINKAYSGLTIMLAVSVWGCATQSVSSSAEPAAVNTKDTLSRPEPLSTAEVISIRNQTMNHSRTLFSVSEGNYTYYIGGNFTAVIDADSRTLVITPEDKTSVAGCEYSIEGVLKLENIPGNKRETATKNCDALIRTLSDSLETP